MILVDSSVWIDYFRGTSSAEADRLDTLLNGGDILVGDLVLFEVLQGFPRDREFRIAHDLLMQFRIIRVGGATVAIEAARNFRHLRAKGFTIRKTVDCLIATRCILSELRLLHRDRDFDPFAAHLGLRSAMAEG